MNPKAAFLIFLAVVIVVAVTIWAVSRWVGHQAGVRRAEFRRNQRELLHAQSALDEIDRIATQHLQEYLEPLANANEVSW